MLAATPAQEGRRKSKWHNHECVIGEDLGHRAGRLSRDKGGVGHMVVSGEMVRAGQYVIGSRVDSLLLVESLVT